MQEMGEVYSAYARLVFQYLMSLSGDADLAEELTQETFYQAIRSADRFRGESKVSTWLCAIAKNQWMTYKKKNRENTDTYTQYHSLESAEEASIRQWEMAALMKMMHELSEPYREVVYLRLLGDLSFADIGDIMGKTENWARVTFYRGKERLRREWGKNEE